MSNGLVFIHLAPASLLAHIEWTISGVSGKPTKIGWQQLPSNNLLYRGLVSFSAEPGSGATLASAFMNLKQLSFEVIENSTSSGAGTRWSFTSQLGLFCSATDEAGNILVGENQLRVAMETAGSNALKLQAELRKLLGQAWDDELEPYRELVSGTEGHDGIVTAEAERVAYSQNIRPL